MCRKAWRFESSRRHTIKKVWEFSRFAQEQSDWLQIAIRQNPERNQGMSAGNSPPAHHTTPRLIICGYRLVALLRSAYSVTTDGQAGHPACSGKVRFFYKKDFLKYIYCGYRLVAGHLVANEEVRVRFSLSALLRSLWSYEVRALRNFSEVVRSTSIK